MDASSAKHRRLDPKSRRNFVILPTRWEARMSEKILRSNIEDSVQVHSRLLDACLPAMNAAADALISAYRAGHKALFFGNGGSAADAQHLAAEFLGRYLRERVPLPAVALSENTSA